MTDIGLLLEQRQPRLDLQRALDAGQLELFYQPVCAPDGTVMAVEALLRWHHPAHGLLAADDFLPGTPFLPSLTAWVLRTATAEAASWNVDVVANVSRADLLGSALPTGTDIEVSAAELDGSEATAITALRRRGVHVTIEDVATVIQADSLLDAYDVDALKLSREAAKDPRTAAAIITLCHEAGIKCIAEGVETAADWAILTMAGCDGVQGYVVREPLPAALLWPAVQAWNGGQLVSQ